MNNKVLCVAAGGSGGHILPALVIAKEWKNQNPDGKIIFFCRDTLFDKTIIGQHPIADQIITLPACKFFSKKIWLYPKFIYEVVKGFFKSLKLLNKLNPEKILSTGGGTAVPVCLAAWILRKKIELYELNVEPGKSIKILSLIASKIFIVFEESKKYFKFLGLNFGSKCLLTSYPIRFTAEDKKIDASIVINEINQELTTLKFDNNRKTLFLFGGSQGSLLLNNLLKQFVEKNPDYCDKIQVIHQVGTIDTFNWSKFYHQHSVPSFTFGYNPNMQKFLSLSDLIICRAGAGTMFEIEFFEKKCLVIPLVSASTSHQILNAYAMQHKHPKLFAVLEQETAQKNSEQFNDVVLKLLEI